ncbi:hypothetical protein PAV_2c05120 [Paenibacillus alvei DSM 29]|nr:hypothetical protein PAV_2c05120 [Paenibacillus alvei DSM 29]
MHYEAINLMGILYGTSIKVPIRYLLCSKGKCSLLFVMVR